MDNGSEHGNTGITWKLEGLEVICLGNDGEVNLGYGNINKKRRTYKNISYYNH